MGLELTENGAQLIRQQRATSFAKHTAATTTIQPHRERERQKMDKV